MISRLIHTPLAQLLRRLALLYGVFLSLRIIFAAYNASLLGAYSWSEAWPLLCGALKFDTASIIYADGLFILLSLLPLQVRKKRWYCRMKMIYFVVVNSLLVVATNLADTVYFHYTQKRFTADEIFFADNSNSAQLVVKFMGENWYLVVAFVLLTAVLYFGYGRKTEERSILSRGWSYYVLSTVLFVVGAGLSVGALRGGFTRMTRPITLSNATLYTPSSAKANLILSNPFCIIRTAGSGGKIRYVKCFSEEELPARFTPRHLPADSAKVDLRGRNVVVFIMESMSAEHSAHLCPEVYEGREQKGFTPFLDSLMRDGLCFRRMYANGTRSIQAMPSVLGSIPSFKVPFVLMAQSLGESRQLPAVLRDMGYSTAFFCGSEAGSMGFGAYARQAGVDRLVSREDYEAKHGTADFDGYWGIWDEKFLGYAGEEFGAMQEPFFASLFTLSSHHPFVVPEEYAETLPVGYTKIHKGVAYDDMAFRRFYERFHAEDWFSRTIFVFVADHVSSEKFAEKTKTYPGNYHIIGFMHTPDGALRGEVEEITQQLDIMPTLLGLVGNRTPYFAFGRDVLNEPDRPAWSVSYEGQFHALLCERKGISTTDSTAVSRPNPLIDRALTFDDEAPLQSTTDSLENAFRALIQQYYTHIERKNYLP